MQAGCVPPDQQISRLPTLLLSELILLMEPASPPPNDAPATIGSLASVPLSLPKSAVYDEAAASDPARAAATEAAAQQAQGLQENASADAILASLLPLCRHPLKVCLYCILGTHSMPSDLTGWVTKNLFLGAWT